MDNIFIKNPEILNKFLYYLLYQKNFSFLTVKEYNYDLNNFFRFLKVYFNLTEEKNFNIIDITDIDIFILNRVSNSTMYAYLTSLVEKSRKVNTRKRKLYSINSFYNWLRNQYPYITKNPIECVNKPFDVVRLPKYLTLEECKKIIGIYNKSNSRHYKRNNLIIKVFLATGIRLSELINIRVKDISFFDRTIIIIGKGNKERVVFLNKNITKELINYTKNLSNNNYLFTSKNNKPLSKRQVEVIVDNAYNLAGIGSRGYTVHTLRHTFATILYSQSQVDILVLKELLGHSTLSATEIYTHIDNEAVRNAVNSNPLSNFKVG